MNILLLQTIDRLGKAGEIISVKEGYARNYLLPKRIAMIATPQAVKKAKEFTQKIELQNRKSLEEFQALAERLNAIEVNIPVKVGKNGKLFGRITNQDVAKALAKEGIVIDRRKIILNEPIKELGVFSSTLKLHPQVEASLKVSVVGS